MPRSNSLIRQKTETLSLLPNVSNNLFLLANISNPEEMRVNKRYFIVTDIAVSDGTNTQTVALTLRPDARGQLTKEFTFVDDNGDSVVGKIVGNIDFERGIVQYGCTFSGSSLNLAPVSINANAIFSAVTSDVGRVKVKLEVDGWDANIDVRDDFELELTTETLQDYNDIWNLDLVRTLSEAIRLQMLLNKDFDLSYYLQAHEPEMAANQAALSLNFEQFKIGGGDYQPNNVLDVFKSIVPMISSIRRKVRQNFRADPQYILAGLKTASVLESLQDYLVNFSETRRAEAGFAGNSNIGFSKMKVLHSDVIPENKVYVIYKPTGDDLSRSVLIDLVYKPLYMIEEVTNSVKRTFVRSRSALEVVNPDALGVITLSGYEDMLG